MPYLDLQRRLPSAVSLPARQAAEAREGWEECALLLYAAHRLLRLAARVRRGGEAAEDPADLSGRLKAVARARQGEPPSDLPADLGRLARAAGTGTGHGALAAAMAARLDDPAVAAAREALAALAARTLDPDVMLTRQDRDARALAGEIRATLAALVPAVRDLEVHTGAGGKTFAWVGPEGCLVSPEAGPAGTAATLPGEEGLVALGPCCDTDRRPRPLLPFPPRGPEAAFESDDGHVTGPDGCTAGVLGRLTGGRALGRLLAWHLPEGADAALLASRLADAGLPEAAGELLAAVHLHGAADRSRETLQTVREFLQVHGQVDGMAVLDAALRRDLEAEEARLREAGEWQKVADTLLARQQVEHGHEKAVTLARLANLFRERLGDRAGEAYSLLTALQMDPSDGALAEALAEAAEAAGTAAEKAGPVMEMAQAATGAVRARLAATAARLYRHGGDGAAALRALDLAATAEPGDRDRLEEALKAADEAGDGAVALRLATLRREAARDAKDRLERTLDLAARLRAAGDGTAAEAEERRALEMAPDRREAFEALADRAAAAGDRAAVLALCDTVADRALDPLARASALRRRGRLLAEDGQDAAAVRDLSEALALDRSDLSDLDRLAHLHERAGAWTPMLAVLRRKVESDPEAARDTLVRMADVSLVRLEDAQGALGFLSEASARAPHDPELIQRVRALHERLGLWSEVARDLERIAEEDEAGRLAALVKLAEVYQVRLARRDKAREALAKAAALAQGGRVVAITTRMAELAREDRDRDAEMKALELAAEATPEDERRADLWTTLGKRALEVPADPVRARRALEKAVAANPVHPEAAELLAGLLLEAGHPEAVVPTVEPLARRAASAGDRNTEKRLRRLAGEAARKFGDAEGSAAQLRRVLELDPDDGRARLSLGRLLAGSGKDEEALPLLDQALATPGLLAADERDEVDLLAARCAAHLGHHQRAVERFEENWRDRGAPPALLREMVEVAQKAGDFRRVARWLEPLADLEPSGVPRFTALVRLGDLYRDSLGDPGQALKWYRLAAAENVSTKAALHKALDAAVAAQDFGETKTLLMELVNQEQDGIKQAQFHFAAAQLARDNLGDPALTREHMWKAVELNPELSDAVEALENVLVGGDDQEGLARLYSLLGRHFRVTGQEDRLLSTLRRLATCYDERLHNLPMAAETLRQVLQAAPRDAETAIRLADVLTRTAGREKEALEAHRKVLVLDPTHLASYRAIRDLDILAGDEDGAWCASAALIVLGHETEADRGRFEARRQPALKLKRDGLPPDGFRNWILDEGVDGEVARVLRLLYAPLTAILPLKQPASAGLSDADLVNLNERGLFQSMAIASAKVLGVQLPRIYHARGRTGIAKVAFRPPALVVGDDVLTSWRGKELRFSLGRAVCAFAPGFELAGVLSAEDLRLFLLAALRIAFPDWPLPAGDEAVAEVAGDLQERLTPEARAELVDVLGVFRRQKRRLDPQAFLEGVDRTCARAGLFMANDLEVACRQLRDDTIFLSDLEFGDRLVDLCAWSVSPRFAELRRTMLQP